MMMKQTKMRLSILSLVLSLAMLLSCMAVLMIPASAEGATYASDEEAVEAGYVFRLNEDKYYKNLVNAHLDVANGDTIYMLANYTNASGHEYVGWNATTRTYTDTKTYTIIGNGHTFTSEVTHGLHFYSANVTIDGMHYVATTGNVGGMRVESTATVTLKNCTFEKTGESVNDWNPAIIVYGTLVLDENTVLKNNDEKAGSKSHALFMEGKDVNEKADATIIPKVVLKSNAKVEAKANCFYEGTKSQIEIQSPEVTLTSANNTIRRAVAGTTVSMSGPSAADLEDATLTEKWRTLYTQMGVEWSAGDVAEIGDTKYSTLTAALQAATDGCTIRLLANVELTGTVRYVPETAVNFTLDGADFTISGGNFTLLSLGEKVTCTMQNITLSNGNGGATGTLDLAGANVTLGTNAKITNSGTDRNNLGNSEYVGVSVSKSGSKLSIGEGAVIDVCGTALKSDGGNASDIVLNGGIVKTKNRGYITNTASSTLTINSGKLISTCNNASQFLIRCYGNAAQIRINGGELSIGAGPIFYSDKSEIFSGVITGGTFTVGDETYTVNKFYGYSLSLNDDIGVNFYAVITDSTATVTVTLPNGTQQVLTLADATATEKFGLLKLYRFSCGVRAAEMGEDVTAVLTISENTETATVSALSYAKEILADETQSATVKALVTAMLHYGAAAQKSFNKNTDHLVNEGLTAPDWSAITADEAWKAELTGSADGLTYYGTSLLLKSKTTIRHWFRLDEGKNIADYTFTMNGETLTATQYEDSELYYVEISGINSSKLSERYTVTVGDMTVTYSALSYAYTALTSEDTDETLRTTVLALVNYANAARAYFTK